MTRRLIASMLCVFLASSGVTSLYAASSGQHPLPVLQIEPSYVSLDPLDDFADQRDPDGVATKSPQIRVGVKLDLGCKVKKIRFKQPSNCAAHGPSKPLSVQGELHRYQKVLRI